MRHERQQAGSAHDIELRAATESDLPAVVALLNRAYRGAGEGASWNSEAGYIDGDRTNEILLSQEIAAKPEGHLLVWRRGGDVQGSVWLELLGDDVWYLGSLAVDPRMQNAQLGRRLLAASEAWIKARGGRAVRMTVVNVRDTLIAWYERRGYRLTGETEPFPYSDARFGVPKRADLAFVVLAKDI